MQRTLMRTISLIMSLALLVQMIPLQIFAAETEPEKALQETPISTEEHTSVTILGEDVSKRTASVKHYRMSDGSFVAVSYDGPVHYQDKKGQWQDINNSPVTAIDSSGEEIYQIANDEKTVSFSSSLDDGHLLRHRWEKIL